jgi:hypothetical protein
MTVKVRLVVLLCSSRKVLLTMGFCSFVSGRINVECLVTAPWMRHVGDAFLSGSDIAANYYYKRSSKLLHDIKSKKVAQ